MHLPIFGMGDRKSHVGRLTPPRFTTHFVGMIAQRRSALDATKAEPSKDGDAKLRGYGSFTPRQSSRRTTKPVRRTHGVPEPPGHSLDDPRGSCDAVGVRQRRLSHYQRRGVGVWRSARRPISRDTCGAYISEVAGLQEASRFVQMPCWKGSPHLELDRSERVSVDSAGVATGIRIGSAKVIASAKGRADTIAVPVVAQTSRR